MLWLISEAIQVLRGYSERQGTETKKSKEGVDVDHGALAAEKQLT